MLLPSPLGVSICLWHIGWDRVSGGGGAQKLATIYVVGTLWCTSSASQARHLLLKEKVIFAFSQLLFF